MMHSLCFPIESRKFHNCCVVSVQLFIVNYSSHSPSLIEHSGEKCTMLSRKVPAYNERIVLGIPNGAWRSEVKVRSPTLAAWKATIILAADPSMVRFPAMVAEKETCIQS
mmetsp:Transcript_26198/g.44675  ORF Transcript_26198/g.44675 Transcript_26198/m.44675 type:complete len:110 (+) Transcript_26198:119-448(+)